MSKNTEGEKDLLSLFGSDSLFFDGDIGTIGTYDVIKTSSPSLDYAIGVGGIPRGRIIQFAGKESSGKTLLSFLCMKQWLDQHPENTAMFIDAEFTYDAKWARSLGLDTSRIIVAKTNEAKKIFEGLLGKISVNKTTGKASKTTKGVLDLVKEGVDPKFKRLGVIVIDSVAAMNTPTESVSDVGKQNMALMPRFLSVELKKLTPAVADANVALIFINQVRTDPGVMYGNPECVDPYTTKIKIRSFQKEVEQEVFVIELFERALKDFDLEKPGVFDISDQNFEIESFDFEKNEKCFSRIKHILIKDPVDEHYQIGTLKGSAGHLLYDFEEKKFLKASEYKDSKLVKERMFVVDFEIEKTHNYFANGFLNHNTTSGGRALKHACSLMLNMAPMFGADNKLEDEDGNAIGHKVKVKIQKNKVGAPFREAIYTIKYDSGMVNQQEELLDLAVVCGVITRPNNRTYILGEEKYTSRELMLDALKKESKFEEVESICRAKYLSGEVVSSTSSDDEDESEEEDESDLFDAMEE